MFQEVLLAPFVLEPVVGPGPDALEVVDFAEAVARAAAGAVALIFGALGFRAEEGDIGEGAIAAVLAGEECGFGKMFDEADGARALRGVGGILVNRAAQVVKGGARGKGEVVDPFVQAIADGDIVGGRAMLERGSIGGLELRGIGEAGGGVLRVIIKFVLHRILDLAGELFPVVFRERSFQIDDGADVFDCVDAAEVAAGETQASEDGELFGGEFAEPGGALVGALSMAFTLLKEAVADDDAGDSEFAEESGDGGGEEEDIADEGDLADATGAHVGLHFMTFSGVVADLGDDEPGTAGDLFFQLEELRDHFIFIAALKFVATAPAKKVVASIVSDLPDLPLRGLGRDNPRFISSSMVKTPTESMSKTGLPRPW